MIKLKKVSKVYRKSGVVIKALDSVNLSVGTGEFVAVRGHSGSGKSTLLLTIGAMITPTVGQVFFDDLDIYRMPPRKRALLRRDQVGFVFQMFHLVPYLNVMENILLPAPRNAGLTKRKEAEEMLERLGLTGRINHKPSELSVGERQRVAIARALLNHPRLILADEPTGNLDPENSAEIMNYLSEFHHNGGTVVLVTHDEFPSKFAQKTIFIRQGKIQDTDTAVEGQKNDVR